MRCTAGLDGRGVPGGRGAEGGRCRAWAACQRAWLCATAAAWWASDPALEVPHLGRVAQRAAVRGAGVVPAGGWRAALRGRRGVRGRVRRHELGRPERRGRTQRARRTAEGPWACRSPPQWRRRYAAARGGRPASSSRRARRRPPAPWRGESSGSSTLLRDLRTFDGQSRRGTVTTLRTALTTVQVGPPTVGRTRWSPIGNRWMLSTSHGGLGLDRPAQAGCDEAEDPRSPRPTWPRGTSSTRRPSTAATASPTIATCAGSLALPAHRHRARGRGCRSRP